jgi:hypothetical protein
MLKGCVIEGSQLQFGLALDDGFHLVLDERLLDIMVVGQLDILVALINRSRLVGDSGPFENDFLVLFRI